MKAHAARSSARKLHPKDWDDDFEVMPQAFLLTFSDLMMLLLTLFVLRLSMSRFEFGVLDVVPAGPAVTAGEAISNTRAAEAPVIPKVPEIPGEVIAVPAPFAADGPDLTFGGREAVASFAKKLKAFDLEVLIEVHGAPALTNEAPYATVWQLSRERALEVVRQFIDAGAKPERLGVADYADAKLIENRNLYSEVGASGLLVLRFRPRSPLNLD